MHLEPTVKGQAHTVLGKIPFSYSSVKSQKSGSRFPSVEKFHKAQIERDEDALDSAAANAIERFGGQENPQTLVELLDLRQSEETCALEEDLCLLQGCARVSSAVCHVERARDTCSRSGLLQIYAAVVRFPRHSSHEVSPGVERVIFVVCDSQRV